MPNEAPMDQAKTPPERACRGEVVDFDEALLDACPRHRLVEVMTEAALLASAFAPEGRMAEIRSLASSLQAGVRDLEMGRAHARLVAAALRRMARQAER
jgi:hypothetical protein